MAPTSSLICGSSTSSISCGKRPMSTALRPRLDGATRPLSPRGSCEIYAPLCKSPLPASCLLLPPVAARVRDLEASSPGHTPPFLPPHAIAGRTSPRYVLGGEGREGVFGDLWACKRMQGECSFQWRLVSNAGPRLYDHDAVLHDGHIWVFGGVNGGHGTTSECLYRYSLASGSWEQVAGAGAGLVTPRSRHQLVLLGEKLVLLGGCGVAGPNDYVSHVAVFDLASEVWETCEPDVEISSPISPSLKDRGFERHSSHELGLPALVHRWSVDESSPASVTAEAEMEAGVLWQNSLFSHQVGPPG